MHLFEINTGYVDTSYVRCYVWASSMDRALELFRERNSTWGKGSLSVVLLLSEGEAEFITKMCDEGFGERMLGD